MKRKIKHLSKHELNKRCMTRKEDFLQHYIVLE